MIDSKTVNEVLSPFLFEPNTLVLRAEMVKVLEKMDENISAEDQTTAEMVNHGAVQFRLSDELHSYTITYGRAYPEFQVEQI